MTADATPADHGLEVQGPYEPDWWCLVHDRSGHGPGCPACTAQPTNPTSEGTP